MFVLLLLIRLTSQNVKWRAFPSESIWGCLSIFNLIICLNKYNYRFWSEWSVTKLESCYYSFPIHQTKAKTSNLAGIWVEIYKFNMCELRTGLSWELNNELTKTYHSVSVAITEKNWPFPLGRHICWWARLNSIKYRVVRVSDFKCTATTTTLIYKGSGGNNSQIYNFSTPRSEWAEESRSWDYDPDCCVDDSVLSPPVCQ